MGEIKKQNTIVLRNLPSNLIEEATIVFKNKKTVREIEKAEKERKKQESTIIPVKNKEGKTRKLDIKEIASFFFDIINGRICFNEIGGQIDFSKMTNTAEDNS